jgi:hypothetical protein
LEIESVTAKWNAFASASNGSVVNEKSMASDVSETAIVNTSETFLGDIRERMRTVGEEDGGEGRDAPRQEFAGDARNVNDCQNGKTPQSLSENASVHAAAWWKGILKTNLPSATSLWTTLLAWQYPKPRLLLLFSKGMRSRCREMRNEGGLQASGVAQDLQDAVRKVTWHATRRVRLVHQ